MKQTKYQREAPERVRAVRKALASGDVPASAISAASSGADHAMRGYPKPKAGYWDEVFVHTLYSLLFTRTGKRR